jgi:hypothetical protein
MSGSQPATVGELHPLHRKALRHPLILDGLFRLRAFGASSRQPRLGTDARASELCLHVLSSFQRTGRSVLPIWLLTWRSPPRLSPSGEPSNLTRRFRFVSTPDGRLGVVFFGAPTRSRRSLAPKNGWGCDLKDCVRGKKICSGWTLANLPTPLVGSRSVHSIYAQRRGLSTLDARSDGEGVRSGRQAPRSIAPRLNQLDCRTFTRC